MKSNALEESKIKEGAGAGIALRIPTSESNKRDQREWNWHVAFYGSRAGPTRRILLYTNF
jgi:hypothetical protein